MFLRGALTVFTMGWSEIARPFLSSGSGSIGLGNLPALIQ